MTIAPIRRAVHTKAPPAQAFKIFTSQIGSWWKGRGVGCLPLADVILQPRVGGRWFERDAAGNETQWGCVLQWDPPGRLVLGWQLNRDKLFDPNLMTEVELTFTSAADGGTDVSLEHRNLERFGEGAHQWLSSIGGGWHQKMDEFAAFANSDRLPDLEE